MTAINTDVRDGYNCGSFVSPAVITTTDQAIECSGEHAAQRNNLYAPAVAGGLFLVVGLIRRYQPRDPTPPPTSATKS